MFARGLNVMGMDVNTQIVLRKEIVRWKLKSRNLRPLNLHVPSKEEPQGKNSTGFSQNPEAINTNKSNTKGHRFK